MYNMAKQYISSYEYIRSILGFEKGIPVPYMQKYDCMEIKCDLAIFGKSPNLVY